MVVGPELLDLLGGPGGQGLGLGSLGPAAFGEEFGERNTVGLDDRQQGSAKSRAQIAEETGAGGNVAVRVVFILRKRR